MQRVAETRLGKQQKCSPASYLRLFPKVVGFAGRPRFSPKLTAAVYGERLPRDEEEVNHSGLQPSISAEGDHRSPADPKLMRSAGGQVYAASLYEGTAVIYPDRDASTG